MRGKNVISFEKNHNTFISIFPSHNEPIRPLTTTTQKHFHPKTNDKK